MKQLRAMDVCILVTIGFGSLMDGGVEAELTTFPMSSWRHMSRKRKIGGDGKGLRAVMVNGDGTFNETAVKRPLHLLQS